MEFGKAARFGARALKPAVKGATKVAASYARRRLGGKGRAGALAEAALARLGGGEGSHEGGAASNGAAFADAAIPIQESIEVAIPLKAAYALCTDFEEYPEFLDRVESVKWIDDDVVRFLAKLRGRYRELEVEIVDERPNQRLDWRGSGAVDHSGVVSFHELAPRLTHIELSVELEPDSILDRLARGVHLSERAIRAEMHRFKAYAELWEAPQAEDEEAEDAEGEPADEEDLDEEPVDEEPVDEEELEDEDELVDEEELDEGEDFEDDEEPYDEEVDELDEEDEEEEPEPARAER